MCLCLCEHHIASGTEAFVRYTNLINVIFSVLYADSRSGLEHKVIRQYVIFIFQETSI